MGFLKKNKIPLSSHLFLGTFIILPSHPLFTSQCWLNVDHFPTCFKLHMLHCYQLLSPRKEPSSLCCPSMQKIKKKKNICAKNWNGEGRSHDLNAKLSSWAKAFTTIGSFVWLLLCRTFILVRPSPSFFTLQKNPHTLEESSFFKFKIMWVKL